MIKLQLRIEPSGDVSQVDTTNLEKGSIFADDTYGVLNWNGYAWVGGGGSSFAPLLLSGTDLINDPNAGWYLEIDADEVINCMVDGISMDGTFDKTTIPFRYYGFANNSATIIKLLIKN